MTLSKMWKKSRSKMLVILLTLSTLILLALFISVFLKTQHRCVVHLCFDEGAGNIAADLSGNNNYGTIYGGAVREVGVSGNCIVLDGVDNYVVILNSTSLSFDKSEGSITFWIKPYTKAAGEYQNLVMDSNWGPVPNGGIEFALQPDGDLFYYPSQGGGKNYALVTDPLVNNVWQFIGVTWKYSTKQVLLYRNGVELIPSATNIDVEWNSTAITGDWHIGGQTAISAVSFRGFNGCLDEFKVYNYALSGPKVLEEFSQNNNAVA